MISQTAKEICFSRVYTILTDIVTLAMMFLLYMQVIKTIWSVICHFVRKDNIQNHLIIPEKWLGMYFVGYLLLCLALRVINSWNIIFSLPIYIGIVSLIWTAYHTWGKNNGKNTAKSA